MAQKFDARQTVSRDVLSQLLGINGTELDDLLRAINKEFNAPLRISASSPADAKINFQPSEVEAADLAAKNITPVSSQIPSFPASTIDFQTGATTGGTINITFPNSTVGFFRRIGFSLDASGTIQAIFSAEAATLGALANAGTVFVKGALPIGWIDLEATAASPGRFKTAGSASNIIEHKVSGSNRVHRIMGGGGSGSSGSGSGTGDDINALTFKASFTDLFSDLPTDAVSAVDYTAGKTDASTYDIVNTYHRLAYDATLTVTGTGVNMTLSAPPVFTIKAGDMLVVGSEARRIASLTSQTVFALESAFTTNPAAAACTVSQAVHSKDLNNFAGDGLAVSTAFPTAINQILMTYEDTTAANDIIFDANTVASIGYQASSDGSNFTNVEIRPQNLSDSQSMVNLPTSGTNMYVRLFANKSSGSGFVNILGYKVFFHRDIAYADGALMNQAYTRTDNTGTKVNVSAVAVVSAKTRIKTSWAFPVGVNSGSPNGAIKVYLDGQKLPRFVDGTVSITAYYKEIDQNTIELDADYSGLPLEVEIVQDVAVVDASDTNTTNVAQNQELQSEALQGFVKSSNVLLATSSTGTPATGTFHSTIANRASILDLTQDLRPRMGVDRMLSSQIFPLQGEQGPNGEIVYASLNDPFNNIRYVGGDWFNLPNAYGSSVALSNNTGLNFIEVTFFGTALNMLLALSSFTTFDLRVSVDGGAEGSNIVTSGTSAILQNRNYGANNILPIVSGLTLGVHTVKIRVAAQSGYSIQVHGFEFINANTVVYQTGGTSFLAGKKISTIAASTYAHNSSFESGTLGTRGGRVVVYQKADGTIAKAVQPVDAAQANMTLANHQNEEMIRLFTPREFGASRSDDFSTLAQSSSQRFFTLDDGTTTLEGNNILVFNDDTLYTGTANGYYIIQFVGTGLDLVFKDQVTGTLSTHEFYVDGSLVGTIPTSSTIGREYTLKIVSGLPYGTHTVRMLRPNLTGSSTGLKAIKVYGPKKPIVPAGAVELADYNVMADYVASASADTRVPGTGVLRKAPTREFNYWGTWNLSTADALFAHGTNVISQASGSYLEYTFFGTGFEYLYYQASGVAVNFTIRVDGSNNLSGFTTSLLQNGTGPTLTAATGTVSGSPSTSSYGNRVRVSGLSLGLHTVRITYNNANNHYTDGLEIITPIHVPKMTQLAVGQAVMIGSQGISDNRKFTPIKDQKSAKAISQTFGTISGPTTSVTTLLPMPDMATVIKVASSAIKVSWTTALQSNTGGQGGRLQVYVDGIAATPTFSAQAGTANQIFANDGSVVVPVTPGVHLVQMFWQTTSGTLTAFGVERILTVEEQ